MSGTIRDLPREIGNVEPSRAPHAPMSRHAISEQAPNAEIAPWASRGSLAAGPTALGGLYDSSGRKNQRASSIRPGTAQSGASDLTDPVFCRDDRRPSVISVTSASSQTSISRPTDNRRAPHKKLAGFFGEDSRESLKGSETSIATTGQRDHSTSSRSKRNNSVYTNSTDGRPTSETSSRARTPPSSDVTPWLFQDFKVSLRVRVCYTISKFASAQNVNRIIVIGICAFIGPFLEPQSETNSGQYPSDPRVPTIEEYRLVSLVR